MRKWLKPGPESGLDCLICATFTYKTVTYATVSHVRQSLPDEEARDEQLHEAPRERARHARGHEDGRVDVQDRLPPVAVAHVPADNRAREESAGAGRV